MVREQYTRLHERVLEPVYRAVGVSRAIAWQEGAFGTLLPRQKYVVGDLYAVGAMSAFAIPLDPERWHIYAISAGLGFGIGLLFNLGYGNTESKSELEEITKKNSI